MRNSDRLVAGIVLRSGARRHSKNSPSQETRKELFVDSGNTIEELASLNTKLLAECARDALLPNETGPTKDRCSESKSRSRNIWVQFIVGKQGWDLNFGTLSVLVCMLAWLRGTI